MLDILCTRPLYTLSSSANCIKAGGERKTCNILYPTMAKLGTKVTTDWVPGIRDPSSSYSTGHYSVLLRLRGLSSDFLGLRTTSDTTWDQDQALLGFLASSVSWTVTKSLKYTHTIYYKQPDQFQGTLRSTMAVLYSAFKNKSKRTVPAAIRREWPLSGNSRVPQLIKFNCDWRWSAFNWELLWGSWNNMLISSDF